MGQVLVAGIALAVKPVMFHQPDPPLVLGEGLNRGEVLLSHLLPLQDVLVGNDHHGVPGKVLVHVVVAAVVQKTESREKTMGDYPLLVLKFLCLMVFISKEEKYEFKEPTITLVSHLSVLSATP